MKTHMPHALAGARRQKGLAMVELAIGGPLLVLLLLGVAELGRMLSHYNQLLQGTRDAARYVASHAMNDTLGKVDLNSALQGTARNLVVYGAPAEGGSALLPGLAPSMVQVSQPNAQHIQVSVNYPFQPVIGQVLPGLFGNSIPLSISLTATTVMRAL